MKRTILLRGNRKQSRDKILLKSEGIFSNSRPALILFGLMIFLSASFLQAQGTTPKPVTPPAVKKADPKASDAQNWLDNFKVFGSIRIRPEYKNNFDFDKTADDVNEFVGQRVQLGVKKRFTTDIEAIIILQDSRVWGGNAGADGTNSLNTANSTSTESTDVRVANLTIKNLLGPISLKVGRQRLVYGDQRLVGHLDWTNVGRSFDGIKLMYKSKFFDSHVWATAIGEDDNDTVGNNSATASGTVADAYFTGWYNTLKFGKFMKAEVYYLGVHKRWQANSAAVISTSSAISTQDRSRDRDNLYTFGARLTNRTLAKGKKAAGPLDWSVEYAVQTGTTGKYVTPAWDTIGTTLPFDGVLFNATNNPCRTSTTATGCSVYREKQVYDAYAFAGTAGFTIAKFVRLGGEYTMASGDPDSGDGAVATFNNLFHTNHLHYGQADMTSWRNMIGRSVNVTFLMKKLGSLKIAYWEVDKHKLQDEWYSVAGTAKTSASTTSTTNEKYAPLYTSGQISTSDVASLKKHLFKELDITYNVKYKHILWSVGYSLVRAGDSIADVKNEVLLTQDARTPAFAREAEFAYLMMTFKF